MAVDDLKYHECMQLTSQFKFCPNAFRVDLYRGCDFGCKYCFANMEAFHETGTGLSMWRSADIEEIKRKFELALETDTESKSVVVELLRHRVPLHCGGMSDPFQKREWDIHLTKQLIEISNKYNYPIQFSTKTAYLPNDYFAILNPKIHAFQVSLMGLDYDYVTKWETNTPRPTDRAEFVQLLRGEGFWCSVRIQPVIEIEPVLKMVDMFEDIPSYYSVEHLHVMADSYVAQQALRDNEIDPSVFTQNGGVLEFKRDIKIKNLEAIMKIANGYGVKVGAADNDLHHMSQSRCCCGTDTIGEDFNEYLKFNSCYLSTGESDIDNIWIPKSNVRRHMNIGKQKPVVYVEDVVKKYLKDNTELIPDEYRENVEKKLFGNYKQRLF